MSYGSDWFGSNEFRLNPLDDLSNTSRDIKTLLEGAESNSAEIQNHLMQMREENRHQIELLAGIESHLKSISHSIRWIGYVLAAFIVTVALK